MKAISLWQPWATFVALKWKTIETRDHDKFKKLVGQRIAIHSARKIDHAAMLSTEKYRDMSVLDIRGLVACACENKGKILCTATVFLAQWEGPCSICLEEDMEQRAMCDVKGKFLLFLEDIERVYPAVPFPGRQGIFNVPDELVAKPYNLGGDGMDKKEIVAALWRLESNMGEFMQKVKAISNSTFCKCSADRDKIYAWLVALQSRAKSISIDRELVEAYTDSPDMNAILYRENKKQTEALMSSVIGEAKELMGCKIDG